MTPERLALIQNPPPDVKEKLDSLKHHRETILQLEKRLSAEVRECERLEQGLALYYSSIAPIHDCPTDILIIIFKMYLEENPMLVRRLMLVCEQWYSVVTSNATLWTKISISFDTEASMAEVIRSTHLYLEACDRYSWELPLNLDLNFGGLVLSPRRGVYPLKWREATSPISSSSSNGGTTPLAQAGEAEDFEALDPIHPPQLVAALLGENAEMMVRCGSIALTFPHNAKLAKEIWSSLDFNTPDLKRLSIFDAGLSYDTYGVEFTGGFTSLFSLEHLEVDEVPDLDFIKDIDYLPLEKLAVFADLGTTGALDLERFAKLTSLTISFTFAGWELEETYPDNQLSLPVLRELVLIGNFTSIDRVEFNLPLLQYLYMQHEPEDGPESTLTLPNVSAPRVEWINLDIHSGRWSRHGARKHLTKVLKHFSGAEILVIPARGKKILLSIVQELRDAGSMPGKWKKVILESDSNEVVETLPFEEIS